MHGSKQAPGAPGEMVELRLNVAPNGEASCCYDDPYVWQGLRRVGFITTHQGRVVVCVEPSEARFRVVGTSGWGAHAHYSWTGRAPPSRQESCLAISN